MDELLLRTRHYPWFERLKEVVVSSAAGVMSLRSGIFWTLSYVLLLALMYLFHSPFRSQVDTRTDWYAQVTKGLQIWLAVVLLCFHVGPHLVASRSGVAAATAAAATAKELPEQARQHGRGEDTVATVFFPVFCFSSSLCLLLHKVKRRYRLVVTYGPSFSVVLINSVLLASFATLHYSACSDVFSAVDAAMGTSGEGSWVVPFLGVPASTSAWMRASQFVCPALATEKPFACLNFLCFLCSVFVAVDYWYKRWHADGNPLRGILWADTYPEKASSKESAGTVAATSRATFLFCRWGLIRTELNLADVARKLGLSKDDPRLQEAAPTTVTLPSRAKLAQRWGDADFDATGWQDEHDRRSIAAEPHVTHPTNRPGMVPWFSTFIMNTTWQALARMSLEFLTFDVRTLQHYVRPRVFTLHFASALEALPPLPIAPDEHAKYADATSAAGDPGTLAQASASAAPLQRESTQVPSPEATSAGPRPANDPDIWFDWIADVGDGFNPTYAMARLLGRPVLKLPWHRPPSRSARIPFLPYFGDVTPAATPKVKPGPEVLPRGSFVVVGGDLAYPSPDDETYTTRLFEPYHDAMSGNVRLQNLFHAEQQHVVVADAADADVAHVHLLDAATVSAMATGRAALRTGRATAEEALRSVPLLFAIPGNHDWFDGLTTFRKYILERTWIGGWLMPQRSSFFVLRLPHNWFMLCGDTGNMQDIDVAQRNYFLDVIEKYMDAESCVILVAHEPGWVYDSMLRKKELTQPELAKVAEVLGTRLRLRIAGDIHHYSRHTPRDAASEAPTLVVSGGGGAFLHGPRHTPVVSQLTAYRRACAFPARNTLPTLLSRLLGFRVVNWKFDLIIGVCCFLVVVSLLPQSITDTRRSSESGPLTTVPDAVAAWCERVSLYLVALFTKGITSLLATLIFFAVFAAAGTEKNSPLWMRVVHSSFWTFLTVCICCGMLSYLLCTLEYMVDNDLLVSADGHWGSAVEDQVRAAVDSLLNHTQDVLGGAQASVTARELRRLQVSLYGGPLVSWCGVFLRCLDPFEMLAYLSEKVSSPEMGTFSDGASRLDELLYYLYFVFFYWILVTPLVSFVIGSYLMVSVTLFDCLYDATYSAFQIEEFKHFLRFRLDAATRELHAYVVIMRHVPKGWGWDAAHQAELKNEAARAGPPHLRTHPSRWCGRHFRFSAAHGEEARSSLDAGMEEGVEILEHFVCVPHRPPEAAAASKTS